MTLQQFKDKYLGKQVEFHSFGAGAWNQCVDLVNAYINEVLDNHTKDYTEIIGTNAKDFNTKYDPEDFDWIANTPQGVPQQGDIIVWNGRVGGGAGHVAIFLEGDVKSFKSLDQNWSQKERVTLETHNYTNVSGWLRPRNFQQTDLQGELDKTREERDRNWSFFAGLCDIMRTEHNFDVAKEELKKLITYQDKVLEKDKQLEDANKKINSLEDDLRRLKTESETILAENVKLENDVLNQKSQILKQEATINTFTKELNELRKLCQIQIQAGWKRSIIDFILSL